MMRKLSLSVLLLRIYIVLFLIFLLSPILVVVYGSFSSASYLGFPMPGYSLRWFVRIFEYEPFLSALFVSLEVALLSTLAGLLLAVPPALIVSHARGKWAAAISLALLSPLSIPMIVLGFALLFFLVSIGIGVSLPGLVIGHTIVAVPYIFRTVLGVHRSIPVSFEESAAILGASRLQIFRRVTLPMVSSAVFAGAMFAFLTSIDNIPLSFFFGSPTTNTLPVVVLSYMEYQFDPSVAAISTLQLVIALLLLTVVARKFDLGRINT